ncbi:hypothetical protein J2Z21_009013 [Streptomyces griseochromogenes]|uniref:Uncharacterized protein n=1 Tax=Streptomyces griseochromogenes TaxID=68214 RepID=A0ABS4M9F6_9ACTN|nr:hypothetical protein [Streptomyces griseochromogenes]
MRLWPDTAAASGHEDRAATEERAEWAVLLA